MVNLGSFTHLWFDNTIWTLWEHSWFGHDNLDRTVYVRAHHGALGWIPFGFNAVWGTCRGSMKMKRGLCQKMTRQLRYDRPLIVEGRIEEEFQTVTLTVDRLRVPEVLPL